jgi:hypothetical protein
MKEVLTIPLKILVTRPVQILLTTVLKKLITIVLKEVLTIPLKKLLDICTRPAGFESCRLCPNAGVPIDSFYGHDMAAPAL